MKEDCRVKAIRNGENTVHTSTTQNRVILCEQFPYYCLSIATTHQYLQRQDGTFTIKDIQCSDSGAYSCEGLSNKGRRFAVDTILEVTGCEGSSDIKLMNVCFKYIY